MSIEGLRVETKDPVNVLIGLKGVRRMTAEELDGTLGC